jgi:hypothetical protein
MVRAAANISLNLRRNTMKQFDLNKLFDINAALTTAENTASNAMTFVPQQVRENVEMLTAASFALVRSNVEAMTKFGEAVKQATKLAA